MKYLILNNRFLDKPNRDNMISKSLYKRLRNKHKLK